MVDSKISETKLLWRYNLEENLDINISTYLLDTIEIQASDFNIRSAGSKTKIKASG